MIAEQRCSLPWRSAPSALHAAHERISVAALHRGTAFFHHLLQHL